MLYKSKWKKKIESILVCSCLLFAQIPILTDASDNSFGETAVLVQEVAERQLETGTDGISTEADGTDVGRTDETNADGTNAGGTDETNADGTNAGETDATNADGTVTGGTDETEAEETAADGIEADGVENEDPADDVEEIVIDSAENMEESVTVEDVKALIDALPEVSELENAEDMTVEEWEELYWQVQGAWDAYELLAEEQQAELTEEREKLEAVLSYINTIFYGTAVQSCTSCTYTSSSNGFCTVCGSYQEPTLSNSVYQIKNAGNLFWFAEAVNGGNNTISAVLCNNIDLESKDWTAIGNNDMPFKGTFKGQGYTIQNFYQLVTESGYHGLFGYVLDTTVENFSITGNAVINRSANGSSWGVIGEAQALGANCYVTKVSSSVNVTIKDSYNKNQVAGIIGYVYTKGYSMYIQQCSYDGTLDLGDAYVDCGGGIVGYAYFNTYVYIYNCLFAGTITSNYSGTNQLGGMVGYYRGKYIRIQNCLSVGSMELTNSGYAGMIGGRVRQLTASCISQVANNYYIPNGLPAFSDDTSLSNDDIVDYSAYSDTQAKEVTAAEVQSGEVTWLLNGTATAGVWKQIIGTQTYPAFSGATVYALTGEDVSLYTNDSDLISKNSDGYYEIYRSNQMKMFAELANVGNPSINGILMADLDMAAYDWISICSTGLYYSDTYAEGNYPDVGYSGIFDGNYHVIKNLSVTSESGKEATYGLFGSLSGTIKNLGIDGFTYTHKASDIRTGAIVGQILGGTVRNCYAVNVVITPGKNVAGGIAGCNYAGLIQNCHVYNSSIKASSGRYGWIAGDNRADAAGERLGTVENCYTDGTALTGKYTGTETNCQYNVAAKFKAGEITWLLNGSQRTGVWKQNIETDLYPNFTGAEVYQNASEYINASMPQKNDGYYEIYNTAEMLAFAALVEQGNTSVQGKMMDDIDMTGVASWGIGTVTYPFSGIFDGYGYVLKINLQGTDRVSPFPYVSGAVIENLSVDGTITCSDKFAAGIIGHIITGSSTVTISECLSSVDIISSVNGDGTHGGLVGVADGGPVYIENCGFSGSMTGTSTHACGGLVGWANATVEIQNSYVAATFQLNEQSCNTFGRNPSKVKLKNCYYMNALNGTSGTSGYMSGSDTPVEKDQSQFQSGEVTWLLNGAQSDGVWHQFLGLDDYPKIEGPEVYWGYESCADTEKSYANYALSDELPHEYTTDPEFEWAEDYTTCTAYIFCAVDATHEKVTLKCSMQRETSEDGKVTTVTASVEWNDRTYTDEQQILNKIVSVDITWSSMEFEYQNGPWNPEKHVVEDGAWETSQEGNGVIEVSNVGTETVDVQFDYDTTVDLVSGTFGETRFSLESDDTKDTTFLPEGRPDEKMRKEEMGSITVTISEPEE